MAGLALEVTCRAGGGRALEVVAQLPEIDAESIGGHEVQMLALDPEVVGVVATSAVRLEQLAQVGEGHPQVAGGVVGGEVRPEQIHHAVSRHGSPADEHGQQLSDPGSALLGPLDQLAFDEETQGSEDFEPGGVFGWGRDGGQQMIGGPCHRRVVRRREVYELVAPPAGGGR